MARKVSGDIPQLAVPDDLRLAVESDPRAGVELACGLVAAIKDSGAFAGVDLIPVGKYREVSADLESRLGGCGAGL